MRSITKCLLLFIFIPAAALADANSSQPEVSGQKIGTMPPTMLNQQYPAITPPNYIPKSPGQYNSEDWAAAIDSVWGPGLSWGEHRAIWNLFWNNMDVTFSAFQGLDNNIWFDVYDSYNQEILDTVSAGRLCAIMNHASLALREMHSFTNDSAVSTKQLAPGVPLMKLGTWLDNGHFGAGLTVTLNSSLLVYKAVDNHPLGLVPGDILLGYDGVVWKDIYPQLLAAELPFTSSSEGLLKSADISYEYTFLVSAGGNWHLFDTIDVVKFDTGDTLHLATDALVGQNMTLYGTEQMEIPGVTIPNFLADERVSWGIVEGTNIGYIYFNSLRLAGAGTVRNILLNALDSLQNFYNVDGLIIDFRIFLGAESNIQPVFDYLFDTTMVVLHYDQRCLGGSHVDLCLQESINIFTTVTGDNGEYWDRPIAVLTGPGAASGGDVFPMVISLHPLAKVFGRPTAGAFTSGPRILALASGWTHWITSGNAYFPEDSANYLARAQFPGPRFPWVDYEEVWLTPDMVALGKDDVVEAAISWIESGDLDGDSVLNGNDNCLLTFNPVQEDADSDSIGDACDDCTDIDGDGFGDSSFVANTCAVDNCVNIANPDQTDNDGDGIGNACCCVVSTGNVDNDQADVVDISDLTFLIDHLFINFPQLACPAEGNVDGDPAGVIDISDLTFLIDHLFINFPPTTVCQ